MFEDIGRLVNGAGVPRDLIEEVAAAIENGGWEPGARLPRHLDTCFGCGPGNTAGFGLQAYASEVADAVEAEHTFDERHMGAPGVAHGGATAAILDDLFGFVLVRSLVLGVTHDLSIRYARPVEIGVQVKLFARLDARGPRKLHMTGSLSQHGHVAATATAVFHVVDPSHLADPMGQIAKKTRSRTRL